MKEITRHFCFGLLIFCSACSAKQEAAQTAFHPQVNMKLKNKATLLQKKLDKAQRTLSEEEKTIERLRQELCEAELNAIESKIASVESQWRSHPQRLIQSVRPDLAKLFIEERETLSRIIRVEASTQRAQLLLDRVLLLITQLSDTAPVTDR